MSTTCLHCGGDIYEDDLSNFDELEIHARCWPKYLEKCRFHSGLYALVEVSKSVREEAEGIGIPVPLAVLYLAKAWICWILRLTGSVNWDEAIEFGYDYSYDSYSGDGDSKPLRVGKGFFKKWRIYHDISYFNFSRHET